MSGPSNYRVAIVGGGLSGLATAIKLHLADPSLSLSLFEASERVGGVIHTEQENGFLIDLGADMFATKPAAALELCRELDVADQLIEPEVLGRGARIVHRGRLLPIPEGFVLMRATQLMPMLTTPLLSASGKLRFLAERWIKAPTGDVAEDESVGGFVRRRMGVEILDRIVAPLTAGIYTADVDKLSMQATMGPIAQMERQYGSLAAATAARRRIGEDSVERASTGARYGQFRAFRGGMIQLIRALADALPENTIRLNSPVQSIRTDGDRWQVAVADDQGCEFDRVIVAAPPRPASELLRDLAPVAARELDAIESASTAIVVLGVRRADIRRDVQTFGFVVPMLENRRILAGSFASHKFAGRAPSEHVLIRVFIGGSLQTQLLEESDDQLVKIAREELAALIGLEGTPVLTRVVRWYNAMPQYHVGHARRVERIEQAIDEVAGLSLVNNALHGVGIAPVIQLAGRIAQQVIASFTSSSDALGSRRRSR